MKEPGKFEHKGIPIVVSATGEFSAKVDGNTLTAPSLAALKKKLDRLKPFEPFNAFTLYHDGDVRKHRIIGVRKHRGYNQYHWHTDSGHTPATVYADTKENMAIVKKMEALADEKKKAEAIFEKRESALRDQLKEIPLPGEEP
jgi:hypothetical protein